VREAALHDAPAIAELMGQLDHPTRPEYIEDRLRASRGGNDGHFLVAELDGGLVGVANALLWIPPFEEQPILRLTALCVRENHRGRKIGSRLLEEVEVLGRDLGCRRLEVVSHRRRDRAHDFYRQHSFQETHRYFVKRLEWKA
jgi:GNAT superfamily N-acetyltransferase